MFRSQIISRTASALKAHKSALAQSSHFSTTAVANRASMAKITVVGTAGRDPEFRAYAGQEGLTGDEVRGVWKWGVAVQRVTGKDEAGNWKDETDWFTVTTKTKWHADKVRKGSTVVCVGDMKTRKYQPDGADKAVTYYEVDCTHGQVLEAAPPRAYSAEPYGANSHIVADLADSTEHQQYQQQSGQYNQNQQFGGNQRW
ncbi:hypothetical protein HK097_003540 [Rhizophlyctis rosea]|uniref:Single-stranded DNA-binding protein n=1 Tax=Rhizophlyctis rosea TaxID=64517 RepID=A0AAD5SFX1_9FUNG|nr:hypothetical protein HK097_003540 [Rhizophlyctis rosea]